MSQKGILEADAKLMWHKYSAQNYYGIKVHAGAVDIVEQIHSFFGENSIHTYVVKPDQLFGKRGKYGLLGINLTAQGVQDWITDKQSQSIEISGKTGDLHTFVIEPFIPHNEEYYIAIKTEAENDIVYFSDQGGMEIEELRDSVQEIHIGVLDEITDKDIHTLITQTNFQSPEAKKTVITFITLFFEFFRSHGMVYLEVNPFIVQEKNDIYEITCLDMVAKIDDCESWKQKNNRRGIERVKPFGSVTSDFEKSVEDMDATTGASLKFSTLNPSGRIALILGGGGASVVVMDTLAQLGLMEEVINYGELSGNPEYRHNKHYVQGMVDMLIDSTHTGKKRLCVIGGISNFTKIDIMCQAFVDALTEKIPAIKASNIHILVRRGGVNDTRGLSYISKLCTDHQIPHHIYDADTYITDSMTVLRE